MDTDYAVEVSSMTRAQILQQAGNSLLAQSNVIPENVLALLARLIHEGSDRAV